METNEIKQYFFILVLFIRSLMSDYRTKIIIFLLRAFTPLREIQQRITTIAGRSYDRPQVFTHIK